jgi:hypothetical protein
MPYKPSKMVLTKLPDNISKEGPTGRLNSAVPN